jgi:hypothetical protein
LYDHTGAPTEFVYRLHGDRIERADDDGQPIGWLTEVTMAKLHAALTQGESLSSMYLRINDTVFDADTEAQLAAADIIEDPLIRCLFNDAFGAYQAAQLRRIKAREMVNCVPTLPNSHTG